MVATSAGEWGSVNQPRRARGTATMGAHSSVAFQSCSAVYSEAIIGREPWKAQSKPINGPWFSGYTLVTAENAAGSSAAIPAVWTAVVMKYSPPPGSPPYAA